MLFHAMLQFSAVRMEIGILRQCGINMALLSAECIRLLRNKVENSDVEGGAGLKDETISAVATLAAVEVNYIKLFFHHNSLTERQQHQKGNVCMLRMHMNGLARMVALRGGLNAIRSTSPMTANWVFWYFLFPYFSSWL